MATAAQWWAGARPRTLAASTAPVLIGTGAAIAADGFVPWKAVLALIVSVSLQVGCNYANDYSDGIRGTDTDRVGPLRLVGSGLVAPHAVRAAAFVCFGVAAGCGLVLALTSALWLLIVGALAIAAAWFYTGGSKPYGYHALGDVSVFVFFGLVACVGTAYVQLLRITWPAVIGAVAIGAVICALLVANNLRDIPTDAGSGKRTLAVVLGDRRTRLFYAGLIAAAYLVTALFAVAGTPWALLAYLSAPLSTRPIRTVLGGATGPALIRVLQQTSIIALAYAVLALVGLTL